MPSSTEEPPVVVGTPMPSAMDRAEDPNTAAEDAEIGRKAREARKAKKGQYVKAWHEAHAKNAKAYCPCCVTKDGAHIYCEIPTKHHYVLPLCLHMVLCPQQQCDPQCDGQGCWAHCAANIPVCFLWGWIGWQSDNKWHTDGRPMCCWEYRHCDCKDNDGTLPGPDAEIWNSCACCRCFCDACCREKKSSHA